MGGHPDPRGGGGGRALVSVSGVCDVLRHPGGNVTQTTECMSGRECRREGCLSVSWRTLTSGSQREEQEPTEDAGSKEPWGIKSKLKEKAVRSDAEPEGFSVLCGPLPSSAPPERRGPLSHWRIFSLEPKGTRQRGEIAVRHEVCWNNTTWGFLNNCEIKHLSWG